MLCPSQEKGTAPNDIELCAIALPPRLPHGGYCIDSRYPCTQEERGTGNRLSRKPVRQAALDTLESIVPHL